tara:strand:+ start:1544 stop:1780 length:237 start_codon:yes stop_codon:yes gene_type:complete
MKVLLIIGLSLICYSGRVYAYPASQMEDCILSALSNPATKSISKNSIKNYCDCALKAIIDEQRDIKESGYECAQQYFN